MRLRPLFALTSLSDTQRSRLHAPPRGRLRGTIYCRPGLEPLESREMLSVAPLYYSASGAGNNLANPSLGSAGGDLLRIAPAAYGDGISTPAGATLDSARLISNIVGAQSGDLLDNRQLSAFTYAWGQFIDHDLDLTNDGSQSDPIAVPAGDPQFDPASTGTQTLPFDRAAYDPASGTGASNPRAQVSVVTAFLDGSMIYGSDATRAAALRTFTGGELKTSAGDLLPFNTAGLDNANQGMTPDSSLFLAGDVRANENDELTSLQTLFMREHNRQAGILASQHPNWSDEQLYQSARQIVIAEVQAITFNQFLPTLLGPGAITPYAGYNPNVNPDITAEFSEAAYRFGHSQLANDVNFFTNDGQPFSFSYTLPDGTVVPVNSAAQVAAGQTGMDLTQTFFNPAPLEQPGVEDALIKYLASDRAQAVDTKMVDDVRNFLFGAPGQGGFDLFALDIQRGRDVGLPTYNAARVAYGLPAVNSFSQITSDPVMQAELKQIYGTVDKVELFVGGLAEDHVRGSSMGPTFQAIIANQFERIRDGDRLWYQNIFSGADLKAIQSTTLADIIRLNTNDSNLQPNVFVFQASIAGHVVLAPPPGGPAAPPPSGAPSGAASNGPPPNGVPAAPRGLPNVQVQLVDASGQVVATTRTAPDGSYQFDQLDLGDYHVQIVLPPGLRPASPNHSDVEISRGMAVAGVDFALVPLAPPTNAGPPQGAPPAPVMPPAGLVPPPSGTSTPGNPPANTLPSSNPPSNSAPPAGGPPQGAPPMMVKPAVATGAASRPAGSK